MSRSIPTDAVTISFLDVGQGAATVIVDHATGKALLIDCPAGREDAVEAALDRHGADLDIAMITHFDDDHSAGVITLIETRPCRQLVTRVNVGYRTPTDISQHRRILAKVNRRAFGFNQHRRNDIGFLGHSSGRVTWQVLAPDAITELEAYSAGSRNRASLVLRLQVRSSSVGGATRHFIFAGDADAPVWRRLMQYGDDLSCDALLWPHHGGNLGSAQSPLRQRLLAACKPGVVVVSAGSRNGHGHPAQPTLDAVRDSGARLMCTEVTTRCHSLAGTGGALPCTGDIEMRIDATGEIDVSPSAGRHLRVISRWDQPQCIGT
ncbi:ComEC/Rec2 family competence protein [Micromonospora chersina]|uniref:ComEC/Rec2 family competence protein n=1 Tax=Micromonospora chersina TaxID=47854 RepID=UPI0037A4A179